VETNGVPIKNDVVGKDVVVDWYFLDGFNTGGNLFMDSNSLQMIDKKLFARKEYTYKSNNPVAANYYPVTSAIAVRDTNVTKGYINKNK